jgi:hypothetical protein
MSRDERVKFLSLKASFESVIDLLEALRNAIQAGAWEAAQSALVGVYQITEYMTRGHFNQYTQVFRKMGQALEARDAEEATANVFGLLAHFRQGHVDVAKRAGYSAPKIYSSNDPASAESPQALVFVESPYGGLVFASLEVATAIDRLHRVCKAKTWEEVRRLLSTEEFEGLFAEYVFSDTGDFDVAEAIPSAQTKAPRQTALPPTQRVPPRRLRWGSVHADGARRSSASRGRKPPRSCLPLRWPGRCPDSLAAIEFGGRG